MSDRIAVMNAGVAEQVGPPFEIYGKPATRFVATFVGNLNTLAGQLIDPASGTVAIGEERMVLGRPIAGPEGRDIALAIRPEAVALGPREGNDVTLDVPVREVSFLGSVIRIKGALGQDLVSLDVFNNAAAQPPAVGALVPVSFASADLLVMDD